MGVTKRAGRKKDAGHRGQQSNRAVFESTKKKEVGVSDLTLVTKITNEAINDNLKLRFEHGEIYTYIGHVLVSVNPFRDLGIYTEEVKRRYEGKNRLEAPPHVFAIAESAYDNMRHYNDNQCVIISGESGAGKTEAAKKMMDYIVYRNRLSSGMAVSTSSQKIQQKVLATNPLLEAFGNAKTLRNNNSSRFGKYLELQFQRTKVTDKTEASASAGGDMLEPIGANIKNYLLEKSRVVGQTLNERNFHIFYQVTKSPGKYKAMFDIQSPETYEYLRQSNCLEVQGIDDKADFRDVLESLNIIQIGEEEQNNIFRVVASILWLGNVTFIEDDHGNTTIRDRRISDHVASLLNINAHELIKALTLRHVETGAAGRQNQEGIDVPFNDTQATAVRDALAKALYFNLFDWIVSKLNVCLTADAKEVENTIGILDIYGFEIFERNSFEQLCINYVNEKLQQIFIQLTLKQEQEEYAREQIQWTPIKYFDNRVVCDLIEAKRPPGVFAALNDACATAHADSGAADQTFVQRINGLASNAHFQPRQGQFIVKHYAGDVNYDIEGMTDKNKDQLSKDLLLVISKSQKDFLKELFPDQVNQDDRRRPPTAGDKIKVSANDLVTTLMQCEPSYIRTIKPNENKSPTEYNATNVLHQIKYLGLQENVRIRRAGFAHRQTFEKFFDRFFPISPTISLGVDIKYDWLKAHGRDSFLGTKLILQDNRISTDEYQIGTSKVFIKSPEVIFALEDTRDRVYVTLICRIQKMWRKHIGNRISEGQRQRDLGHKVLQSRKERRRFSLVGSRRYLGDYLGVDMRGGYGEIVRASINIGGQEKTLFSCRSELLVTKFGRSSKPEPRLLVLTNSAVHIIVVAVMNQQATIQIERSIPLINVKYVSTSSLKDDWFSIGVGSPQEPDPLLSCIFKTEFFSCLNQAKGNQLSLKIGESIEYNKKPGKSAFVKAIKDPSVQRDDFYKSGKIHTGPGEPPNSISKDPPRTKEQPTMPSSRPTVKRPVPAQPARSQQSVSKPVSSERPIPQFSISEVNRASAVAQSNSFAAKSNSIASQSNGVPTAQARNPPPLPPSAAPPEPKKNLFKVLYDYDGTRSKGYEIFKDEILESMGNEKLGWFNVKRQGEDKDGWAPTAYLETYNPPAPVRALPPPAPTLPIRHVPPLPPVQQTNGPSRSSLTPSPEPGAKAKATPPLPPKRPGVKGKKPAPPPTPRDSAVSMGTSNGGSGRDTPDSIDGGKAPSMTATDLASLIRARGQKMQPTKRDDDW